MAKFAQKVLSELYVEAHNPKFESRDISDSETNGYIDSTGKPVFKGPIIIAKSEFKSYFNLASTIGHELNHAADYFNGNNVNWLKKGIEYQHSMSELKAYRWEANNGGMIYTGEIHNYVIETILWNKFSNFKN